MRGGEDGWFDEEGNCVCKKEGKCSLKGLRCLGVKDGEGRKTALLDVISVLEFVAEVDIG